MLVFINWGERTCIIPTKYRKVLVASREVGLEVNAKDTVWVLRSRQKNVQGC